MKKKTQITAELIYAWRKAASDPILMRDFMWDILTPKELDDIELRWQIVKRIKQGIPHRDIAEELGVGVAKVTRGSLMMRDKKGGFNRLFNKLDRSKK